jgi:hypothetical protein
MVRLFPAPRRHQERPPVDIMKLMKFAALILVCGAGLYAADLNTAHSAYILGMSHGMDQYLANRIVNDHVLQVVTDPKLADVIITDHIGPSFEAQMTALNPPPPAPDKPAAKADSEEVTVNPIFANPVNKIAPVVSSSLGRNKGTYFLVDAKSREILWSVYDPPKSTDSNTLDRTASDIVSRLKKDMKKK